MENAQSKIKYLATKLSVLHSLFTFSFIVLSGQKSGDLLLKIIIDALYIEVRLLYSAAFFFVELICLL